MTTEIPKKRGRPRKVILPTETGPVTEAPVAVSPKATRNVSTKSTAKNTAKSATSKAPSRPVAKITKPTTRTTTKRSVPVTTSSPGKDASQVEVKTTTEPASAPTPIAPANSKILKEVQAKKMTAPPKIGTEIKAPITILTASSALNCSPNTPTSTSRVEPASSLSSKTGSAAASGRQLSRPPEAPTQVRSSPTPIRALPPRPFRSPPPPRAPDLEPQPAKPAFTLPSLGTLVPKDLPSASRSTLAQRTSAPPIQPQLGGIRPGGPSPDPRKLNEPLPKKYRPAARRVLATIVALPIVIVTSYELYQRLALGKTVTPLSKLAPVGTTRTEVES